MDRTRWKISGLAFVLALALATGAQAQQGQQHHRGGEQMSEERSADISPEVPERGQMMRRMQGMMESMQGMMEHMQGMTEDMQSMMGRRGMMGMMGRMGRSGMMGHMRGMMRHGGMFLRHLERLTQQLDLTDEQETQVRSRVRTHMKDAIRVKADLEIKTIDLHNLLETEPMDLPKVKELLHAIASQKADLHFAHITLKQEIGKLLTPEQQKKFRSMRRHMMRGHDGMMGHGSMMGQEGMMRRRGMRGTGGMRNPCGMMGRGAGNR